MAFVYVEDRQYTTSSIFDTRGITSIPPEIPNNEIQQISEFQGFVNLLDPQGYPIPEEVNDGYFFIIDFKYGVDFSICHKDYSSEGVKEIVDRYTQKGIEVEEITGTPDFKIALEKLKSLRF
jgi:hypothetical protein